MKKLLTALSLFTSSVFFAQNGKGQQFPSMTGETFDYKAISLPEQTKGKISIIGVCFSKGAEDDLKTWLNPLYNMFIVKKDTNDFFSAAANYDVHFYFIPMLNKVNQILAKTSKEKIRKDTDKEFWPYLIFYTGSIKPYKEDLSIKDTDKPYFFVLDKSGKIVHVESGKYDEKKMSRIEDFIE
ncbi:MAG: hypothetical protein ACJ76F_02230 [Bacteroidia bacterium]